MEAVLNFVKQTGFYMLGGEWQSLIMVAIACLLLYLAIVKKFEPLLLLPIAFGMLLTNLVGAEVYHEALFAGGHAHWDLFGGAPITQEFLDEYKLTASVASGLTVGQAISPGLIDYCILALSSEFIRALSS